MITVSAPANASSHQIEPSSSLRAGRRVRRARRIVEAIATTMNGTMITGCIDSTHSFRRAAKKAAV